MDYQYHTDEYVLAFIDVLGAKNKIAEDADASLNVVHHAYTEAINALDKMFPGIFDQLKPKIRIFSDNIVIAYPTNEKGKMSALVSVMVYAGLIQHEFLHHNYLVRGGIAIGDFFIDDVMLWGTALTRAYELESEIAIYPRIVLDPKLIEGTDFSQHTILQNWVYQDVDGLFFIDYMQKRNMRNKDSYLLLVNQRLTEAEEMLRKASGNLKVEQKVRWHWNYLANCADLDN